MRSLVRSGVADNGSRGSIVRLAADYIVDREFYRGKLAVRAQCLYAAKLKEDDHEPWQRVNCQKAPQLPIETAEVPWQARRKTR